MPPAISDDEASDYGDIAAPVSAVKRGKKSKSPIENDVRDEDMLDNVKGVENGDNAADGDENDEEDDEELDENEFVVEKITAHMYHDGIIKFEVKWEGYEKKSERTWEDEENLRENASAVLDAYLEKVGGRNAIIEQSRTGQKGKKRGRPATGTPTDGNSKKSKRTGSHPASATPPASVTTKKEDWKPPAGTWEDLVESLDACHDENTGKLIVYITWTNGNKTQHDTKVVYKRCPQKMLAFYEQHVKIVKTTANMDA